MQAPVGPLHESDDDEATEFLSLRPQSSASSGLGEAAGSSLRARGRAVPLEVEMRGTPTVHEAATSGATERPQRPTRASASRPSPQSDKLAEKLVDRPDVPELPSSARISPTALPMRTHHPLPGERQTNVHSEMHSNSAESTTPPRSPPRIMRIVAEDAPGGRLYVADEPRNVFNEEDEVTAPPGARVPLKARPLPASASHAPHAQPTQAGPALPGRPAPRPPTVVVPVAPEERRSEDRRSTDRRTGESNRRPRTTRTPLSLETLEAEPPDGTLIVEVPPGAIVFIDGIERGVGPSLRVSEIDRYAKHAVRIHAPGCAPWSGSVCLDGRTAAKIRPGLKPKK